MWIIICQCWKASFIPMEFDGFYTNPVRFWDFGRYFCLNNSFYSLDLNPLVTFYIPTYLLSYLVRYLLSNLLSWIVAQLASRNHLRLGALRNPNDLKKPSASIGRWTRDLLLASVHTELLILDWIRHKRSQLESPFCLSSLTSYSPAIKYKWPHQGCSIMWSARFSLPPHLVLSFPLPCNPCYVYPPATLVSCSYPLAFLLLSLPLSILLPPTILVSPSTPCIFLLSWPPTPRR